MSTPAPPPRVTPPSLRAKKDAESRSPWSRPTTSRRRPRRTARGSTPFSSATRSAWSSSATTITLPVTMDDMLHHARAVAARAAAGPPRRRHAVHVVPGPVPEAVRNAGRLHREGGLTPSSSRAAASALDDRRGARRRRIPVMGHIGLTPQSVHAIGGFRVQGRTSDAADALIEDALALEGGGRLRHRARGRSRPRSRRSSRRPSRPDDRHRRRRRLRRPGARLPRPRSASTTSLEPRFVKRYASLLDDARRALEAYRNDVAGRRFPGPEHAYPIPDEEWNRLLAELEANPVAGLPRKAPVEW